MAKPNLKTATFKEVADWVYASPNHEVTAEGLTFKAEKPTEENRKVDIEVGGFQFWYPSWGGGKKDSIMLYGNPNVSQLPAVVKAMELVRDVFGIKTADKDFELPQDTVEPMSETEKENLQLQAKLEVYQSLLPAPARVTLEQDA